MNTTIKSAIAACGFLAAVSAPLTAGADTFQFFGKNTFGYMNGGIGNFYLRVRVSESATLGQSKKTSPSALIEGENFTESECWYGAGSTDNIQFKVIKETGSLLKQVTASGSAPVTWYDYCTGIYPYPTFTETVTFNMDLRVVIDETNSNWGTVHSEYGEIKSNRHFDDIYARAVANASSIISPKFGTITSFFDSYVGQSKGHGVEIIR